MFLSIIFRGKKTELPMLFWMKPSTNTQKKDFFNLLVYDLFNMENGLKKNIFIGVGMFIIGVVLSYISFGRQSGQNYYQYYQNYNSLLNTMNTYCGYFDNLSSQFQKEFLKGQSLTTYKCVKGLGEVQTITVYGTK